MRKVLAGTLLVLALAVAGCGGSSSPGGTTNASGNGEASKPAQQVLNDAVKAAEAASALHMTGQIPAKGQQIGIDMTIVKGKGAMGSLTLQGQKVDLLVIGSDAYMKAGSAFWAQFGGTSGSTIAPLVADKWVKFSTANPQFQGFTAFTDSRSLFESLATGSRTITNKGATTYNGQSVVNIFDTSKNGNLYVAATGTAYPVAVVKSSAGGSGAITFDNWNQSVTLTAPSGAIDFSHLGG